MKARGFRVFFSVEFGDADWGIASGIFGLGGLSGAEDLDILRVLGW